MILAVVEHDRGTLNSLSLQMVTAGRRLAAQLGEALHAVVIGEQARPLATEIGQHGVSTVHLAQDDRLDDYIPAAWAQCVIDVMQAAGARVVLAAASERGQEVMAHVAARTDLPLAANCTDIRLAGGHRPGNPFSVTRMRWGGSLLEDAIVDAETILLTIAPHAFAAEEVPASEAPTIETFTPMLAENDFRVRVTGRVAPDANKISLADAKVVVGGGRGIGSVEGFQTLEEIAELLGGTVGCSRAVTSLGWRPHSDQVGQTGTRIAPTVYIACGISGAIQHMVGCKSAKCIVAINKDPEAPIMALADYSIVGDVQQVLPALRDAIKAAKRGS